MLDLMHLSYYFCVVIFLLLIISLLINLRDFLRLFAGINRKSWAILIIVFILALFLRLFFIPHMHYVFYDEYEHINIAKNMSENKIFARCNFYLDGKCFEYDLPQWVPGYHFLLSLVFSLFGISESVAYDFNAVLGSVSVIILFLTTFLISNEVGVSLVSALLLTFLPLHLRFSGNSSLEITSSLFILLSILSALVYLRLKTNRSFFFFVIVNSFTLLLRTENGLVLLLLMTLLFAHGIQFKKWLKLIPFSILFVPYFLYLPFIRKYAAGYYLCKQHPNIPQLLLKNLWYWISNHSIPIVLVIMAIIGIYSAVRRRDKILLWFLLYFFSFVFFYTFIHKGDIYIGDFQRFNIQFYHPVLILASVGLYVTYHLIIKYLKIKWLAFGVLFLAFFLNYIYCYTVINSEIPNAFFQRQHQAYIKGKDIDDSCVFIAYNPSAIITSLNKSSVHIAFMFDETVYKTYLKDRCLVLVKDYGCYYENEGFCSALENKYKLEEIKLKQDPDLKLFYWIKKD